MSSSVTKNQIILREELASIPKVVNTGLVEQLFSGNASTTAFALPAGFKPYAIYVDGARKLAATYTLSYDINICTITFGSAPASGTNNIQIDMVRA